jgi:hypothetical protein
LLTSGEATHGESHDVHRHVAEIGSSQLLEDYFGGLIVPEVSPIADSSRSINVCVFVKPTGETFRVYASALHLPRALLAKQSFGVLSVPPGPSDSWPYIGTVATILFYKAACLKSERVYPYTSFGGS